MKTIIARNNTSNNIYYRYLDGITITASGILTLSDYFSPFTLAIAEELLDDVTSGDISINDGTNYLSSAEGVEYLSYATLNHTHPEIQQEDYNSYTEIIRENNYVSTINKWYDNSKTKMIESPTITRTSGRAQQVVKNIYDTSTGTIVETTVTGTIYRDSVNKVTSVDIVSN